MDAASTIKRTYTTPKLVTKSKIDYGGVYEVSYKGGDKPKYYIFVLHPKLENKVHCLDLSLIEESVFENFFSDIKITDTEDIQKRLNENKGIVKSNIKIAPSFYDTKIKTNQLLTVKKPYKTLDFDRIQTVKYIPYDND
jgi:hypothetical protein